MREYLGPADIANNVSMLRGAFDGTILVVEGITDYRLYGKLSDLDNVELIVAHSKDNAAAAVKELYYNRKDGKVLGIVDSDLDRVLLVRRDPPLFQTDTRDLEGMMIRSGALEEVLWEYGDRAKMERFVKNYGEVRDVLISSAYPLGILMLISENSGRNLCFRDLDFGRFIDRRTLQCDIRSMVDEVIYNSHSPNFNAKELRKRLEEEMDHNRDPWIVCRGHDLVDILVIGLRYIFGSYNCSNMRCGELGGALRLAFDMEHFADTDLYHITSQWADERGLRLWISDPV
ncbi:MAG: DUF4435 domain-containing protein [Thermoplasmatales archaeon]|nr:DUF4435 domain-containing protein [Thermoplasmatales archaeon]